MTGTKYNSALVDLDGVLYQGEKMIPGAEKSVSWLQEEHIPHLFLTNTTSRPRNGIGEKIRSLGIDVDNGSILTPVIATAAWLRSHCDGPAALFMPEATKRDLDGIEQLPADSETGAAAVVLGDLGEQWNFATLNRAFRLLMDEPAPPLIALGMTRYWRAPDGLRLDVAPFVKALEHATGREALILGKPSGEFFRTALDMINAQENQTLMIGDDIVGDVGGARRAGLGAVLVRTGKFRPQDLEGDITPDAVLESIADLPEWWQLQ